MYALNSPPRGLAIFEDNALYEGDFADAGQFSGQGVLTYSSGDSMVGYFDGTYTDGMRFNGTIYKALAGRGGVKETDNRVAPAAAQSEIVGQKIGLFSVSPGVKWKPVFEGFHVASATSAADAWESLAIQVCKENLRMERFQNVPRRQ